MAEMKPLTRSIRGYFGPILEREGFSLVPSQEMSYLKLVDGITELHVDVQDLTYAGAFSVSLQDLSWDGKRRARSLERFSELRHYSYGNGSDSEIEMAVRLAAEHLSTFGVRWLKGEEIETAAILDGGRAAEQARFGESVRRAREAFKNGNYEEALVFFSEAARIQPLDDVSEKFRAIATSRLRS